MIGRSGFSDQEVDQLLGYELVHVRHHHTVDVLLCEVLKVALWFNPFVWLYARELKRVHEYQADQQMVSGDHAATYLQLLYHQLSGREIGWVIENVECGMRCFGEGNYAKKTKAQSCRTSVNINLEMKYFVLVYFATENGISGPQHKSVAVAY